MKSINLYSILSIKANLDDKTYRESIKMLGISPKDSEIEDLNKLALLFHKEKYYNLINFFMDFKIPQINCEFDLLRISRESIVNIELKRTLKVEKAKEQLLKHEFYLNFLNKPIYCYTFVADENTFYHINEEGEFKSISIKSIIGKLDEQQQFDEVNLLELFTPRNFLVSPFNSYKKFLDRKYILTEHQQNIKNEIMKIYSNSTDNFLGITGGPGTGKTLLTYDIARTFIEEGKRVLIIHCAELNIGQRKLNLNSGWVIKSIASFASFIKDINNYDIIIFDECQRNNRKQFDELIRNVKEYNKLCIFSYDAFQCFTDAEFKRKIHNVIQDELKAKIFSLTNNMRINDELSSFITNLFDKKKVNQKMKYKNVNLLYFRNVELVKSQIRSLIDSDWEVFNYTGSFFDKVSYDKFQFTFNENVHQIIGQEFDKIVAVIDEHFFYNQDGLLESRSVPKSAGYNLDKMLYQILTRSRLKITLIIINNKDLYENCLKIINI